MAYTGGPPPYSTVSGSAGPSSYSVPPGPVGGLEALTIFPQVIGRHSSSNRVDTESFRALVDRANEFLRSKPHYTVNTCESVEFPADSKGGVDQEASAYLTYGESSNRCVRALRLWLEPRDPDVASENPFDRIGYYNFLPQLTVNEVEGEVHEDEIERLDSLVARINEYFPKEPVPGRIVTIETQPIKLGSRGLEPDATMWTERGSASTTFVNLLRVFYVEGRPRKEEIGMADFVPERLQLPEHEDDWSNKPAMETFPAVLKQAQRWLLSVPPNYRPINVQCVTFRWSFNLGIDTQRMTYHERKNKLHYLRYLRVAFVIEDVQQTLSRSTIQLHSTLFIPDTTRFYDAGVIESQPSVLQRIADWAVRTRASVVSVETLCMRMDGGGERYSGFDAMYTWNSTTSQGSSNTSKVDQTVCTLFRVYTDGSFPDVVDEERTRQAMAVVQKNESPMCCTVT